MYFKINLKKLVKNLNNIKEDEALNIPKKELNILKTIAKSNTVGDIDWGAFTMEELQLALEYRDEYSSVCYESKKLCNLIHSFEPVKYANNDVF